MRAYVEDRQTIAEENNCSQAQLQKVISTMQPAVRLDVVNLETYFRNQISDKCQNVPKKVWHNA